MNIPGLILIAAGLVYLFRPGIFRRSLWTASSLPASAASARGNTAYVRALGLIFLILGLTLVIFVRESA